MVFKYICEISLHLNCTFIFFQSYSLSVQQALSSLKLKKVGDWQTVSPLNNRDLSKNRYKRIK